MLSLEGQAGSLTPSATGRWGGKSPGRPPKLQRPGPSSTFTTSAGAEVGTDSVGIRPGEGYTKSELPGARESKARWAQVCRSFWKEQNSGLAIGVFQDGLNSLLVCVAVWQAQGFPSPRLEGYGAGSWFRGFIVLEGAHPPGVLNGVPAGGRGRQRLRPLYLLPQQASVLRNALAGCPSCGCMFLAVPVGLVVC